MDAPLPHFMEICPMEAALIHAERQADITEGNRCFFITLPTHLPSVQFNQCFVFRYFVTKQLSGQLRRHKIQKQ